MFTRRPAQERGHTHNDWLDSYHSFSFGDYFDPQHMGLSNLRVINDDRIAAGAGFATHAHHDMEIITYVLDGALEHKDSMGNGSLIRPGDVQRMSAGSGVRHSEFNPSPEQPAHILQIWLQPNAKGVEPGYQQQHFSPERRRDRWATLVTPDGRAGSIASHQDALLYGALLSPEGRLRHALDPARQAYVHIARGHVRVNGECLNSGDGVALGELDEIRLEGIDPSEILLFDLA